jgi:hypothetical protein
MKGIPNKNNFSVLNVLTNEKRDFKTLSEIAKEYNINYYTARELNRITENDTEKTFLHKKLAPVFDKIKIFTIKDDLNI